MYEPTTVRENLMNQEGYTPYCGNPVSRYKSFGCDNPRTKFNGDQFVCPHCGWVSAFPQEFIIRYKTKWNMQPISPSAKKAHGILTKYLNDTKVEDIKILWEKATYMGLTAKTEDGLMSFVIHGEKVLTMGKATDIDDVTKLTL